METRGNDAHAIRAVLRDGVICPVEPLPRGWVEGQELTVLAPEPLDDPEDIDAWHRETEALVKELIDEWEIATIEAELAEAGRRATVWARREMGLV